MSAISVTNTVRGNSSSHILYLCPKWVYSPKNLPCEKFRRSTYRIWVVILHHPIVKSRSLTLCAKCLILLYIYPSPLEKIFSKKNPDLSRGCWQFGCDLVWSTACVSCKACVLKHLRRRSSTSFFSAHALRT